MKTPLVAGLVFSTALVGCGGSGDGSPIAPPIVPPPIGLYLGTSSAGRTITGLVMDDGSYYFIYSAAGNSSLIGGAIQGVGIARGGSFTSSNGIDINLEGSNILPTTVSASYALGASLNGTVNYSTQNSVSTFTSAYGRDYELTPSLGAIAGTYTGLAASPTTSEQAIITISESGAISGSGAGGCRFSGSFAPRAKGNAYSAYIALGLSGPPCLISGESFSGIAYLDAATKRLYVVEINLARNSGFIFSGTKP